MAGPSLPQNSIIESDCGKDVFYILVICFPDPEFLLNVSHDWDQGKSFLPVLLSFFHSLSLLLLLSSFSIYFS